MNKDRDQHAVRRIVLPSGRSIEVIRFDEAEPTHERGLHVCPGCECELVQPVSWSEAQDSSWELVLSCPNCGWGTEGVFTHEQVTDLEEHLDDGLCEMLDDLRRLTQANMAEEIDRFATALHADLILPEDF